MNPFIFVKLQVCSAGSSSSSCASLWTCQVADVIELCRTVRPAVSHTPATPHLEISCFSPCFGLEMCCELEGHLIQNRWKTGTTESHWSYH